MVGAQTDFDQSRWLSVRISFGDDVLLVGPGWTAAKQIPLKDLGRTAMLKIQAWDEQAAVYVNDKEVFRGSMDFDNGEWGSAGRARWKERRTKGVKKFLFRKFCIGPLKEPPAWSPARWRKRRCRRFRG